MIYPNPAVDAIRIKILDKEFEGTIEILDLEGKVVLKQAINQESLISVKALEKGMYIYSIRSHSEVYNGKFVKK